MLPHDVYSAVGSSTGNASRSLAAPRAFHFLQQSSHARTPLRHGQLYGQQAGAVAASSSAPRPIPARGGRVGATATVEAPASAPSTSAPIVDFGYDRDIESKYEWGRQLGKGGNGVVRVVECKDSGEQYACKAIGKVLEGDYSDKKKAGHVDSIRREVEVLRRLSGSLNIVKLVDVYEDEQNVYVVQELCKGGELWHRIGEAHYSERTVASFMRAVLRTIAQCHSHHILHRDIKPGNFMLLDHSDRSPLKAIDFGLAMPFDPEDLPRRDLGLEGTPWYMAPEVLSSQVVPASDVWSAGVMAHQLLTGRLPFDDHRNPFAPSISAVWRSVLTDKVDYNMPWWEGLSDEAKDFVHTLLDRDPAKRPSAKEALKHPWLQGNSSERSVGKQIDVSVVARIQRFAQNNRFKRSVLRLIAEELLARPGALAAESALAAEGSHHGSNGSLHGHSRIAASPTTGNPIIHDPNSEPMQAIYRSMQLNNSDTIDRESAAVALSQMGYKLDPTEVGRLLEQVDTSNSGKVRRAALAASQIDWRYLQQNQMSDWLDIARRAFASLDKNGDGCLCVGEIMDSLRTKLPPDELRLTVQQAMAEAGHGEDAEHMDFEGFLRMLKVGSVDSLDQYDARWDRPLAASSVGSIDRLQSLLDVSNHGSDGGSTRGQGLYAGVSNNVLPVPGSVKPVNGEGESYKDKSWHKPMVNFKFDFGNEFIGRKINSGSSTSPGQGPPETRGAPDAAPVLAVPAASASNTAAADYFNSNREESAVRGGGHFDKRMHGASLYRNAVISPVAPSRPGALYNAGRQHPGSLAPVKE